MKFETFESMINIVVDMYKDNYERDMTLTKAFGGDSCIVMEDCGKAMDRITDVLSNEFSDTKDGDWINYLVFENLILDKYDPEELRITIENKKYPVTIKVIWDILNKNI